LIVLDMA
jgi:hypothetical protein